MNLSGSGATYAIKISGEIGKGDAERFRRTLLDADPYYGSGATFMVYLDSPGGRVFEAIEIGNAIRSLGFNTFVADEAICRLFFRRAPIQNHFLHCCRADRSISAHSTYVSTTC